MPDIEKVIKGIERCLICNISVVAPEESQNAYRECEYTVGLYCEQKKLFRDVIALLKEQQETIDNLNETVRNLLQHIEDIGQYMTPIGRVEDVKAFVESRPQIVRCKDCKYSLSNSRFCAYPHKKNNIQPCDWYCADGERKE